MLARMTTHFNRLAARWRLRQAERAVDRPWAASASSRLDEALADIEAIERAHHLALIEVLRRDPRPATERIALELIDAGARILYQARRAA